MKARTPKFMARFCLPLAVIAVVSIATTHVAAEDTAAPTGEAASSAPVTAASDSQTPPMVQASSQSITSGRSTYQNPFGSEAQAPPMDGAVQSSTAGQWRRPTIPRWVAPPSEDGLENKTPDSTEKSAISPGNSFGVPAVQQAVQQAVNTNSATTTQPVNQTSTTQKSPKPKSPPASAALIQPDSVSNGPAFPTTTSAVSSTTSKSSTSGTTKKSTPTANSVADHADTSATCVTQAQAAASHANSVESLGSVIELCDRGLSLKPSAKQQLSLQRLAAWAHNRRGETLAESQHLDDALRDFQAAIEHDPKCSLAIHNRGVTFAQRNQFAAALRDFNRVIELNPGLAVAYRNRAELLSALDRTRDALADYDRAITALPNDVGLYLARAHAKQRLGNFAGAAADVERALKLNPNDGAALVQRGNLAADQGMFADAEKDLRHAIALNPNHAEAHRSLAWLQATCPDAKYRKPDQALASAKRAAELLPDDYQTLDTLAAAEASLGNFSKAIELQQQAVAAAPLNLSTPLQQRLAQYEQPRAYRTPATAKNVRTASMEDPTPPPANHPATRNAKRSDIIR